MKNILITGGASFIGSNFTRYILEKDKNIQVFGRIARNSLQKSRKAPNFQGYKKRVREYLQ